MLIRFLFLLLIGSILIQCSDCFPVVMPNIGSSITPNVAQKSNTREITTITEDDQKSASYIWRYGGPYGHYCGIFHTDRMFIEPIDAVDRACQLHDTCISGSQRYLDCFCNEQLLVRMYDTCPGNSEAAENKDASYYRDQIIRAMNIGTSMCSSDCNLFERYKISPEHGFNAIPFYGPQVVEVKATENVLVGLIGRDYLKKFAEDNLIGRLMNHIDSFKKMTNGSSETFKVPDTEILFVLGEPLKITSSWFFARIH